MTLNQLRYFQAVCRCGGVNKAAELLKISQPSISNSIKELEAQFGVALFLRKNKQLILTQEGSEFLKLVNSLLDQTDETVRVMNSFGQKKTLTFGVPPMLSSLITPVLYKKFLESKPDFNLEIIEGQRDELLKKLENHQINIALLPHDKPFESKFCYEDVAKLQSVCCCSKNHKFANKAQACIEDFKNEPLILFKNSFFQTQRILDMFSCKNIEPEILLSTVQVSTLQNMVLNNLGLGFVYEFLLKFTPELVGIPLNPPLFTDISLVWKKEGYSFYNINKFLKFAKQIKAAFDIE